MKKFISLIVTLTVILGTINTVVFSAGGADTEVKDGLVYLNGTNRILYYAGDDGICTVPEGSVVEGLYRSRESKSIKKLVVGGDVTFDCVLSGEVQRLTDLKEAVFGEGITEIPYQCLMGCPELESVTLPSTLKTIGDDAFRGCPKLKSISLPDGLESIGEYAFYGTKSLSGDVIIPDTVTYLGGGAFSYSGNLGKVHLPDSLSEMPDKAWFSGTKKREINIPDAMLDNPPWLTADEIAFNSDMTVKIYNAVRDSEWCKEKYLKGKTDKSLGSYKDFAVAEDTVLKYLGDDKNPVVPEGIKSITEYAFAYRDMDTVTLPKSLESIDTSAFAYTTLKEVVIPKNVKTVSDGAFRECELIEKVTFEGAPTVGTAFPESGLLTKDNVIIKDNAIKLSKDFYAFEGVENNLDYFYERLADNGVSVDKAPVAKPTAAPEATPVPTAKPQVTSSPTPVSEPKTLEVNGADMSINVDGKAVDFPDAKPYVDDYGRTQVPVRAVAEMLDCDVDWNGDTKTATVTRDGGVITLKYGSDIMTVNDKPVQMDTSVIIKNDRTYIPIRFVAEALGLAVEWK